VNLVSDWHPAALSRIPQRQARIETIAPTRPQATGATEFDDIEDAVVGFRTEAPNPGSDPAASPLAPQTGGSQARSAEHGSNFRSPDRMTEHDPKQPGRSLQSGRREPG
jgi:hypothetical protein